MPAVRIPGAPSTVSGGAGTATRHPILLHCTPALKLPQHDVGKLGYKRRLVVCARDEMLCFREDGLMKLRVSWRDVRTVQHIPVEMQLPSHANRTDGTTPPATTTTTVHVVLITTNTTSRDAGFAFRSAQDAQTLINIAVTRKRQMLCVETVSNRSNPEDMSEVRVLRRDASRPPITASQLQQYLSSSNGVVLKRPANLAPVPSAVPTVETLASGQDGGWGADSGVLFEAISELRREADRCKAETAAAASATHWSSLAQYRDALNHSIDKKRDLDALRVEYKRRKAHNETALDKAKAELASSRAELRSVSSAIMSTREAHDRQLSKLREECHSSEERSKAIVLGTNHDEVYLSSQRQAALHERSRLTSEIADLREWVRELQTMSPSTAEEKGREVSLLESELEKMKVITSDIREENAAIKDRLRNGGAVTRLQLGRSIGSRSQSLVANDSKKPSANEVVLRAVNDEVEVSEVIEAGGPPSNDDSIDILDLALDSHNEGEEVDFVSALQALEAQIAAVQSEKSTVEAALFRAELALRNTKVLIHKQRQASDALADSVHTQRSRNAELAEQKKGLDEEVAHLEQRVSLFAMETMVVDDVRREAHLHTSIADTASRSFDFSPTTKSRLNLSISFPANGAQHSSSSHFNGSLPDIEPVSHVASSGEQAIASQLEHLRRIKERLQHTVDSLA